MKALLILILTFLSLSTFAGDLHVNCYLNNDEGESLAISSIFTEGKSISLWFQYDHYAYIILVSRKSIFRNYSYEAIRIDKLDSSFGKEIIAVDRYDQEVQIDQNIACRTTD